MPLKINLLEKEIENKVVLYAKKEYDVTGYKFTSPAHRSVPDRMFLFPNGLTVFIEFKREGKKLTSAQKREGMRIVEKGHFYYIVDSVEQGKDILDQVRATSRLPSHGPTHPEPPRETYFAGVRETRTRHFRDMFTTLENCETA